MEKRKRRVTGFGGGNGKLGKEEVGKWNDESQLKAAPSAQLLS
jgi:hypothetical protein